MRTDVDAMAEEIARTCGAADAAGYRSFVAYLRRLYALEMPHFIDRNLDSPAQLLGAAAGPPGADGRLPPARRQGRPASSRDERLRRLFSFQAMYAGLAPGAGARDLLR